MAEEAPSLFKLCSLHFASLIGNGRVPPIDFSFPTHMGDSIVSAMRTAGLLNESSLITLARLPLSVTKLDLSGCSHFHLDNLSCLSKYDDLLSLNVANAINLVCDVNEDVLQLKFDLNELLHNISSRAKKNIRHLNIGGRDTCTVTGFEALQCLTSLESLSLGWRTFYCDGIGPRSLCETLPKLRVLDISETDIGDIAWLSSLPLLEALFLHNVKVRSGPVGEPLMSLHNLRVLDISRKVADFVADASQEYYADLALTFVQIAKSEKDCPWPELRSIDFAGSQLAGFGVDQAIALVDDVIGACPKLQQISLLATTLDGHTYNVQNQRDVEIINCANRQNSIRALTFYWDTDRDVFTSHALHSVYYCLQSSYDEFSNTEVIECATLICNAMKRHLHNIQVQMAGSACLYHLCKVKRIRRLSPTLVQNCMNRCLDAAETYQHMVQLQKNVWLTICNDYLLQLPGVNFYRTCKVALESMLSNRDSSVARMTIAIVSIVTPKMRPPEARELTGDQRYVRHLVRLLSDTVHSLKEAGLSGALPENSLFTLRFTLSALWNLTDESFATCQVLHEANGIDICFDILSTFPEQFNIQTKVLGVLNNVAEVPELKRLLLKNEHWVAALCSCLLGDYSVRDETGRNRAVERSYFAAGVLSNLLASPGWIDQADVFTTEFVNKCLEEAIRGWPELPTAMVSYRSFTPFDRILKDTSSNGAHMWCLWGVLHVLTHKDKQTSGCYMTMLGESDVPDYCAIIARSLSTHPYVRSLANQILRFLSEFTIQR